MDCTFASNVRWDSTSKSNAQDLKIPTKLLKLIAIKVILLIFGLMGLASASLAEVEARPEAGPSNSLWIKVWLTDSITKEDADRFDRMKLALQKNTEENGGAVAYAIYLDSTGGDVEAAMRIGRAIRSMKAIAIPEKCYSACVLTLAGAGYRAINERSRIGIHRPYQRLAVVTTAGNEKEKYAELQVKVEQFLSEMNVSPKLYSDMMMIPSHKIKILTIDELSNYGLAENDPYFDEADEMNKAVSLGISRQELVRRRSIEFDICGEWPQKNNREKFLARFECRDRVLKTGK